jgi:class 3 adenylate cyclase/tetratricopeptide (TPR) repeat protein
VATCGACGAELPPGAAFCPSCGTPTGPQAEFATPTGERKLVTVLFADVTGSTALGERLDPERLREVLETYFAAMREEIEAEGGTVEKFIGDAVMAAFGVPTAHEDDAARAVRAATRMLERLETVNEGLAARHDVRLRIRIGVNSGEVLATTEPRPGEPMVTGDVVNAAQRLEAAAEPGTVVIGERTARSLPGARLIDLGPLDLKGKAEPLRAYRLDATPGLRPRRGVPGLRAPMVGRAAEMDVLRSLYARVASEGRPSLVTIYGDAGVGKSRLTREFLAWAEGLDRAPLSLGGRCLPYGDGVAYWPLAEILKTHAGILDTDGSDLAIEKVRKIGHDLLTTDVTADPALATAALAYTIGLPDPESPLEDMDPQRVRSEVDAAWRSFFTALAASAPTIVVIEDIHWADPVLLDLLETLADRVEGPALFLCPSRPDLTSRRPTWGGGRRAMSAISLDPLTADQSQHLIELLLTVDDLPPSVHATMIERAEGNPFFLEEIIRRLIDDGSLAREGDRWRAAASIAEVQIPDTVQAVLASRIDLLDASDKRILQMAGVVGRVFWPGPVAELSGASRADVEATLERLLDRELVLSRPGSTLAGEREYLFKHILTRDVAYGSLPRKERGDAHRAVAAWLETTAGERASEFAELLAYHCTVAVELARELGDTPDEAVRRSAVRWSLVASRTARKRVIFRKAERLAAAALDLAVGDAERTDALESLGKVELNLAQGDLAYRYFREAMDTCERMEPLDGPRVAYLCARACEIPQRWPGSLRGALPPEAEVQAILERGFAALPPGDSKARVRLLGLRAGWPFAYPDDEITVEQLATYQDVGIEAAETALRLGDPDLASASYDQAIGGWLAQGLYGHAEPVWRLRRAIAADLSSVAEIGDLFAMGAWLFTSMGRYQEAIDVADEGLALIGGRGPNVEMHGRGWKLLCYLRLGSWDRALEELEHIRRMLGDQRDTPPYYTAAGYAAASAIHARRGERVAGDALAETVVSLSVHQGTRLYADAVKMHLARGEVHEARARPLPDGWRVMAGECYEAKAQALAAAGAWDEAPGLLEEMRACVAASPWRALEAEIPRLEGRATLAGGDTARGLDLLAASAEAWAALGCTWERAVTDLEIAEAGGADAGARASLAAQTFEHLRTPAFLARARALTTP